MFERIQTAASSPVSGVRWAYVAIGVVFVVIPVAILHQTALTLVDTWYRSETFNHCFLIIPVAGFLVWQKRAELAQITFAPDWRGGVALGFASLLWFLGYTTRALVVEEFGLVLIVQAVVLTLFGWPMVRTLIFPLGYLYFLVPFGAALIPPMRMITADFAVTLLRDSGVPVFNDGNLISIPTGNWYIAEACAGLRYLVASLALGVLFAGLIYRSWYRRIIFLLISVLVPIVANGIRAYGIILLAYKTDNKLAAGVDHIIYGFIFFTLVTFTVLAVGMSFRERAVLERATTYLRSQRQPTSVLVLFLVGLITLVPVATAKLYGNDLDRVPAARAADLVLPDEVGAYRQVNFGRDPATVVFAGADAEAHAAYASDTQRIYLYVGYYVSERPGAEVVSSDHELSSGRGTVVATGSRMVGNGSDLPSIRYIRTESPVGGQVIWYWYWVDGKFTGNPYWAKLLQVKAKLLGGKQPSAIIVAKADYDQSPEQATRELENFTGQLGDFRRVLEKAR